MIAAMRLVCLACLVHASFQSVPSDNEDPMAFGSGFAAIANDLASLGKEDKDIRNKIATEEGDTESLEEQKQHIHQRFEHLKNFDSHLHQALRKSRRTAKKAEKKYQHALGIIKAKYEAQIKGLLPRLHVCSKQRDELASELNVASAELYMAQERLQEAYEQKNATKKNWTNLVGDLAHAVDADEQRSVELRESISNNENTTRSANFAIADLHIEEQHLQQVLANASSRLQSAKAQERRLDKKIEDAQRKGAEMTKQSSELSSKTNRLLKKIEDQVHIEHSSATIAAASKNASKVQKAHLQEIIMSYKAQIDATHVETAKATAQLQDVNELLAKDRALIEHFQHSTLPLVKSEEAAKCKHELAKVEEEDGQRVAALRVALDQSHHDEAELSEENRQLLKQVEALKQQIARSLIQFDS